MAKLGVAPGIPHIGRMNGACGERKLLHARNDFPQLQCETYVLDRTGSVQTQELLHFKSPLSFEVDGHIEEKNARQRQTDGRL